jgi:L-aspartate semialdehyde sulfurtransferase ferredoxin
MYSGKIVVRCTPEIVQQPIICQLAKQYDLVFNNMLKARVFPRREGVIVLELSGLKENFDQGVHFLKETGLKVDESLPKSISQNVDKCVYCGACTSFCPTGALSFEKPTFKVLFDPEKCQGCKLCVSACPVRAMEVNLL